MQRAARCLAVLLALSSLCGARAVAQDAPPANDADYQDSIDRGMLEFDAGRFVEARTSFEQAHAFRPSARTLRGLGVTAIALKHYNDARDELEAALADLRRPLTEEQRSHVTQLLEWMDRTLGRLRLSLDPPTASASIDEQPVSRGVIWLDVGEHRLVVAADGFRLHEQAFRLLAQQQLSLDVKLALSAVSIAPTPGNVLLSSKPAPVLPKDEGTTLTQRWWFWTGLAVVALAAAGVTFVLLNQPEPDYERGGIAGIVRTLKVSR